MYLYKVWAKSTETNFFKIFPLTLKWRPFDIEMTFKNKWFYQNSSSWIQHTPASFWFVKAPIKSCFDMVWSCAILYLLIFFVFSNLILMLNIQFRKEEKVVWSKVWKILRSMHLLSFIKESQSKSIGRWHWLI